MEIILTEHLDKYEENPWYTLGYEIQWENRTAKGYVYVHKKNKKKGLALREEYIQELTNT